MTTLQKAIKALEKQVGTWFGDAILNGAKIKRISDTYAYVDGSLIMRPDYPNKTGAVIAINIKHEELDKIWRPSISDLQKRKEQLESELKEIKNQIEEIKK